MIPVRFEKARAEKLIDCLENGKPIEPEPGGWSAMDMLSTAGALFFGAMSSGPAKFWPSPEGQHPEHREAAEKTFLRELHDAIEFFGQLTMLVADRQFDEQFEPRVTAIISHPDDGPPKVRPDEGFKGHN